MTDVEPYQDPILTLVQDSNLNRDHAKSSQLIKLIREISERKLNKLCSTCFVILQTLDKIQLKFKSWEFLSLDYNSDTHFVNNDDKIKIFNTGVADKVIVACTELNIKMVKISSDIDLVSKLSKLLSVKDLMSDEGTILTSLLLRIIKSKNEIIEELSIFYSKAKLILIGRDLEILNEGVGVGTGVGGSESDFNEGEADYDEEKDTINYYKTFIVELLRQLNDAILANDFDAKYECLAVINDLEKMFEKYKMERMIDKSIEEHEYQQQEEVHLRELNTYGKRGDTRQHNHGSQPGHQRHHNHHHQHHDHHHSHHHNSPEHLDPHDNLESAATTATTATDPHSIFDMDNDGASSSSSPSSSSGSNIPEDTFSEYSLSSSIQLPMVRSITNTNHKNNHHHQQQQQRSRADSVYSYGSPSLYKSTISEELPYLMTAFSSAKNFKEDVSHYKQEEEQYDSEKENKTKAEKRIKSKEPRKEETVEEKPFQKRPFFHKALNLPNSSLYSETNFVRSQQQYQYQNQQPMMNPLMGNSLLRTLGIRPQVISVPEESVRKEEEDRELQRRSSPRKDLRPDLKVIKDGHVATKRKLLLTEENIGYLNKEVID